MTLPRHSSDPAAAGDPEDARLVAAALAGDRAAFRALHGRHRPAVDRVARAFATLDRDDAEDVVQDAFVRAFANLAKLSQPGRFGPWLLTIARNRALSRIARRRASERLSDDLSREAETLAPAGVTVPEGGADAAVEIVRRIVASLPDGPEKETVQLFYVEGKLSAREIAERLGVGKSAITMRLERFRAKVKRTLLAEVARLRGRGS
ncbi:MAG TPA: sigma-70 family RNA polymerase sigma factor [Anaeromyxobacter sp.]